MANPIVVRSLDEIKFWSRIMKEHALFLSLGFTYEQQQLIDEARQFISLFERIEERLSRFTVNSDLRQVQALNTEVYQAAAAIWNYKRKVLGVPSGKCGFTTLSKSIEKIGSLQRLGTDFFIWLVNVPYPQLISK